MKESRKTKAQIVAENHELRERVTLLEERLRDIAHHLDDVEMGSKALRKAAQDARKVVRC